AIAAGAGLGILPAFTADQDPRLQLIMPAQIRFIRTFWMLMPIELKDIARMRVTWDFLREMAERERGRLIGVATESGHQSSGRDDSCPAIATVLFPAGQKAGDSIMKLGLGNTIAERLLLIGKLATKIPI